MNRLAASRQTPRASPPVRPSKESALVARLLNDDDRTVLGDPWVITAKKRDFYVQPLDQHSDAFHISCHGPGDGFGDHQFHVKVNQREANQRKERVGMLGNAVPKKGFQFPGRRVSGSAYLVIRLRWSWQLERPRFRAQALWQHPSPATEEHQTRLALRGESAPNAAWDFDIYVSFGEPYFPQMVPRATGNPRFGPIFNSAGYALTAMSHRRNELQVPTPAMADAPLPKIGETPNRVFIGSIDDPDSPGIYWCNQTISTREHLEERQKMFDAWRAERQAPTRARSVSNSS